ncbi:hypothetical protein K437DRAFT_265498 [Tilletiaria anomala UBC 951]|uniref:Uncharacterized protein n=1 Tax=Tilletiaria anomala (strain ATCC 24038 / CBS 436.72 / UBC 951) TaxID=1037660 RepID=A0A066V982_TILAU|nr:uncharacterized protein K437DRAFT_265498 [Tilletiaria anomala UBC 951]KDN35294.1 hypothetical protein K437DRAFT_265498 [Tilletiaria anomala UBC 951]
MARTILRKTKIVIADEATTILDLSRISSFRSSCPPLSPFASSKAPPYNPDGKLPTSLKDSIAGENQQESADANAAARPRGLSTKARWLWGTYIVSLYTQFYGAELVANPIGSCNGGSAANAGSRCEHVVQAACTGFAVAFVAATVGIDCCVTILHTLLPAHLTRRHDQRSPKLRGKFGAAEDDRHQACPGTYCSISKGTTGHG